MHQNNTHGAYRGAAELPLLVQDNKPTKRHGKTLPMTVASLALATTVAWVAALGWLLFRIAGLA